MALSRKPQVLYRASIERMAAARREFDAKDYALCMYLSGLAVECILQAIALRFGAAHDARHDLAGWLTKCPARLPEVIKGEVGRDWNRVVAMWDNSIRYMSSDALLRSLRDKGYALRITGGPESILRVNAKGLLDSADSVQRRGIAQWVNFTKK